MSFRSTLFIVAVLTGAVAHAAEGSRPFEIRGTLPWHNFLSGPTAWNENDWRRYLDWMQKSGLNLLVLHCYTGGAQRYVNYVEPMIRIQYRNVVPEAFFDTSLTARWGYRPLGVGEFAFGTGKLFGSSGAFGSDAALLARDNEDRYRRAQSLIRRVFDMAHARGIQVGMGFEFGVHPPELFSIVPQDSYLRGSLLPDPTHPASQEILHNTIDDILRAYPGIDWIWLWLQEHEAPAGDAPLSPALKQSIAQNAPIFGTAGSNIAFTGVWALEYIRNAHAYLAGRAPKVRLAISGWGGGRQLTGVLGGLDKGLPQDIVFSCLNPAQGLSPQPPILGEIAEHRQVWVIPWLEGDAKLWHPQPRVGLLREHVQLARRQGAKGVVAIHWRTEDIRANMEAFARFANGPELAPAADEFYRDYAGREFGAAAATIAPLLARMDGEKWFESIRSMEYYPYDPGWGRLTPELRKRIQEAAASVDRASATVSGRERDNVNWLTANLHFTLLLDETGKALEPAYKLKTDSFKRTATAEEIAAAR
jgi:hypothetical protein